MFMSSLQMSTRFMAMFLLVSGRHICVPQRDANMAGVSKPSSINLGSTFLRIPRTDLNLSETFFMSLKFLNLFISTLAVNLLRNR